MFHVFAFAGSVGQNATNAALPAVVDQVVAQSPSGRYYLPRTMVVFAADAHVPDGTRARINTAGYRDLGLPEIFPIAPSATPGSNDRFTLWGEQGPRILQGDELGVDVSRGGVSPADCYAALFAREIVKPVPSGRRTTAVGTASVTLVANAWAAANIAFDTSLPFGIYSVIGMAVRCTNAVYARLIFPDQARTRPGCIVSPDVSGSEFGSIFRSGYLGEWGQFVTTATPTLEVLGTTAGAQTATVYLDLVQVSTR